MIFTRDERRAMERAKEKHVKNLMKAGYSEFKDITAEAHDRIGNKYGRAPDKVYQNGQFIIQVFEENNAWNAKKVMIRWLDARPEIPWAILQKIKNDLFGAEVTALEVFPKESNKVDVANMYWIWILPEGFDCPIEVKRK